MSEPVVGRPDSLPGPAGRQSQPPCNNPPGAPAGIFRPGDHPRLTIGAVLVVVAVAGAGIWLATAEHSTTRSASTSSAHPLAPTTLWAQRFSPPTVSAPALPPSRAIPFSPEFTPAEATLLGELPPGYDPAGCTAKRPPTWGATAKLHCQQNSEPGGPRASDFWLFGDGTSLANAFDKSVEAMTSLTPCAAGDPSPAGWSGGQIACGSYLRNRDVTWTNRTKLLLGDAQGPDLAAMFTWFGQYANT